MNLTSILAIVAIASWAATAWLIAENEAGRREIRHLLLEQDRRQVDHRNLVRFWKREAEQAQVAATDARRARVEIRAKLRAKDTELDRLRGELDRARLATPFALGEQPRKRDDRGASTLVDGGAK